MAFVQEASGTYIAIHRQAANLSERKVAVRPHLCHVEDVPFVTLSLLGFHDLHEYIPNGEVALLDSLKQIFN